MNEPVSVAGLLGHRPRSSPESPRRSRLALPVIADFVEQIVGGTFSPGTALPSEAAMCEYLGVSRTVMREVLKALEQKGLVEVVNGVGTKTTNRDAWKLIDPLVLAARIRSDAGDGFVAHLVRVRIVLEGEMAGEAAKKVADSQVAGFRAKLDQLESAIAQRDVEAHFRLDFEFHDLVMRAAGNELARAIVLAINDEARAHLHYEVADVGQLRRSQRGHVGVYEALAARDGNRAAHAMRQHIEDAWQLRVSQARKPSAKRSRGGH
jgi:DNA-binding FadR family transcriptional regulator